MSALRHDICTLAIVPMMEASLPEVVAIERDSFDNPWSMSQFKGELDNPVSFAYTAKLALGGGDPELGPMAGYSIFWVVSGEAHILNICVAPWARRRGVGKGLLDFALNFMDVKGVFEVFLEVRPSNMGAIKLYESYGFKNAYRRRNYYGDEDAQVMSLWMK